MKKTLIAKDIFLYTAPTQVRLNACSLCQLSCPACGVRTGPVREGALTEGYLRAKNFVSFLNSNPQINTVGLAFSGEIFLNPELKDIVKYAFEKKVALTAWTGVNLNDISDEMCENLVKYQFRGLKVSIDGTDDKVYAIYRRGGSFSRVIENIKKINFYKKTYKSEFPALVWQFIPFGHNEHQIVSARRMAMSLGMGFRVQLNASPVYSPVKDRDLVRRAGGLGCATRREFMQTHGKAFVLPCYQLWTVPQIDWDGKLLGCCNNLFVGLGNVFRQGLAEIMKGKRYVETKKAVLGVRKPTKSIPCYWCPVYTEAVPPRMRIRSTVESLMQKKEDLEQVNT